ncbi:uncharacterized protein LOC120284788 [Drosophila simulans]|uniref:uncharacterized protein LOC120284788 n=1 Tax=Drosophila simulans TaxID=7240 RepID=UPI00192D125A|nr:uncharacterized protein LOC120284788 [Drosophila simulans]
MAWGYGLPVATAIATKNRYQPPPHTATLQVVDPGWNVCLSVALSPLSGHQLSSRQGKSRERAIRSQLHFHCIALKYSIHLKSPRNPLLESVMTTVHDHYGLSSCILSPCSMNHSAGCSGPDLDSNRKTATINMASDANLIM